MAKESSVYFEALSKGERGTMIYIVQKMLNSIGYELEEDGVFSSDMEEVIKQFQAKNKNLVVDGIVGYETMKALDETRIIN